MDMRRVNLQHGIKQCETHLCSINECGFCKTHKTHHWSSCLAVLHYDWDLKIVNDWEFVNAAMEMIDNLVKEMLNKATFYGFDREFPLLFNYLNIITEQVDSFHKQYDRNPITIENADLYTNQWRNILKDIFESQLYSILWLNY